SGRGMGLSVVKETVDRLQGEIEVNTRENGGLRITISVALSISTQQLLLVETAGCAFGIPARTVSQLSRVRLSEVRTMDGRYVSMLDGRRVPLTRLSDMLGLAPKSAANGIAEARDPWIPIVTMIWGEKTAGVIVDRLLDERDAVVKDLGLPQRM